MKIFFQLLFASTLLIVQGCWGQTKINFTYKKYNAEIIKDHTHDLESVELEKKAFKLVNLLPKPFVMNGTVDYTSYIQEGLNRYDNVLMPDFPVLINQKGLITRSNTAILFGANSQLRLKGNALTNYKIIQIHNVTNIKIFNLSVVGDRNTHLGSEGEWGMGVSIRASSNITLVNPVIKDCWGDGIYISQIGNIPSRNIEIFNAHIDHNRRNGISIISVDGLKLIRPLVANTIGTNPMAGIDIEPNNNNDFINNVLIENATTFNVKNGILIVLGKLAGPLKKSVEIDINNHNDTFSYTGLFISGFNKPQDGNPLGGFISIKNPIWKYNIQPFRKKKQYAYAPNILLSNMVIIGSSKTGKDEVKRDSITKVKNLFSQGGRVSFN